MARDSRVVPPRRKACHPESNVRDLRRISLFVRNDKTFAVFASLRGISEFCPWSSSSAAAQKMRETPHGLKGLALCLTDFNLGDVKLAPIRARSYACDPFEEPAKKGRVFVPHVPADLVHRRARSLEPPLRFLDAQPLNIIDGRVPGGAFEAPLETALRNTGDARGLLDGIAHGGVAGEPALRLFNRGVAMTGHRLEYDIGREAIAMPLKREE